MKGIGPFDGPIPVEDLKRVAAVVPQIEIRDIRLVALTTSLRKWPSKDEPTTVHLSHKVSSTTQEDSMYTTRVAFELHAKKESDDDAGDYISLKASFQLWYQLENAESVDSGNLAKFSEVNAVHTAWPYFRELVQNISGRMGIPPMTVPLLKVGKPKETPKSRRLEH